MLDKQALDKLVERQKQLETQLASPERSSQSELARQAREHAQLRGFVQEIEKLRRLETEIANVEAMIKECQDDKELLEMAKQESQRLNTLHRRQELHFSKLLLPENKDDDRGAILEIRSGTGGHEAALFAKDLLTMYQRYGQEKGWKMQLLHLSSTDLGGIKEAVTEVSGKDVFAHLKFESGVHRVQRVPQTESSGRIHTSAATVAVLPLVEEADATIDSSDLRIDVYRSSGPGGQSVNTTDSAVRITHLPTGVTVCCQDEKSQHRNRASAMKILRSRLYELESRKAQQERSQIRRTQIGSGDRSERIRTYNFPQNRVTDHRIGLVLHDLTGVLAGKLDCIVERLVSANEEEMTARAAQELNEINK